MLPLQRHLHKMEEIKDEEEGTATRGAEGVAKAEDKAGGVVVEAGKVLVDEVCIIPRQEESPAAEDPQRSPQHRGCRMVMSPDTYQDRQVLSRNSTNEC